MDQVKIGKFLAETRKQRGMTQRELAEKIGISDKTVSKWECGNSMPDISYLESVCNSLDITVNELLSGEQLSEQNYSEKAEENIMALMKENEISKKGGVLQILLGIALGCLAVVLMTGIGGVTLGYFIDLPALVLLMLLCVAGILISGKKSKSEIIGVLQKVLIPSGVLIALFEVVIVLIKVDDISTIGPNLAVCILTPLYALIVYLIVTLIKERKTDII